MVPAADFNRKGAGRIGTGSNLHHRVYYKRSIGKKYFLKVMRYIYSVCRLACGVYIKIL